MIEIQIIDENDENICSYSTEVAPRIGEYISVQDVGFFKVDDIEHYVRKYGGTGSYISPHMKVVVSTDE